MMVTMTMTTVTITMMVTIMKMILILTFVVSLLLQPELLDLLPTGQQLAVLCLHVGGQRLDLVLQLLLHLPLALHLLLHTRQGVGEWGGHQGLID